jgi:uncharacterized protein YfiM (DUF2279 family)
MRVDRMQAGAASSPARKAASGPGFAALLPEQAGEAAETGEMTQAAETGTAAAIAAAGYEAGRMAVMADRSARRHGKAMLQALGALQRALLGADEGDGPSAACTALADLAGRMPEADDPLLRLILREIAARAAVELARFPI